MQYLVFYIRSLKLSLCITDKRNVPHFPCASRKLLFGWGLYCRRVAMFHNQYDRLTAIICMMNYLNKFNGFL